jgi:hypothetical protein
VLILGLSTTLLGGIAVFSFFSTSLSLLFNFKITFYFNRASFKLNISYRNIDIKKENLFRDINKLLMLLYGMLYFILTSYIIFNLISFFIIHPHEEFFFNAIKYDILLSYYISRGLYINLKAM